jgi:hypothetical protein
VLHPDYIQSYISFFDIDSIIEPKFLKTRNVFDSYTLRSRNHGLIFNKEEGKGINEHFPIELINKEAFDNAKQLIQNYIDTYPKPFFDYWTDIRCFLPFIETDDIRYVANTVFAGYGMKKKMIIWKLCNHPKYEAFKSERVQIYEKSIEKAPNDKGLQQEFKDLLKFLKRLNATPPLYDWDDSYLKLPS